MSYAAVGQLGTTEGPPSETESQPLFPEGGFSSLGTGTQVLIVGGGVAVLGLIGFLAYQRMQVTKAVVEKHGVGGALAFEGGLAAIGALSRGSR